MTCCVCTVFLLHAFIEQYQNIFAAYSLHWQYDIYNMCVIWTDVSSSQCMMKSLVLIKTSCLNSNLTILCCAKIIIALLVNEFYFLGMSFLRARCLNSLVIERLSMTFTANGKRQKWNFSCLSSVLCTVESKSFYLLWIVRDTFLFLCDLFKDYKKRIENQR